MWRRFSCDVVAGLSTTRRGPGWTPESPSTCGASAQSAPRRNRCSPSRACYPSVSKSPDSDGASHHQCGPARGRRATVPRCHRIGPDSSGFTKSRLSRGSGKQRRKGLEKLAAEHEHFARPGGVLASVPRRAGGTSSRLLVRIRGLRVIYTSSRAGVTTTTTTMVTNTSTNLLLLLQTTTTMTLRRCGERCAMRPHARLSLTQRRSTVTGITTRPACQPSRVIGLRAVPCLAVPRRGALSASDPENNGPPSFRTAKTRPRNGRRSPPPTGVGRHRPRSSPTPMHRALRLPPAMRQSERGSDGARSREWRLRAGEWGTFDESVARRHLRTAFNAACTA